MLFSFNWIKEFVKTDVSAEALCDALTMAGIEADPVIEEEAEVENKITNVVTAKIITKAPHPDADKLSLCTVTTGDEELHIVCGATNMAVGDIVPLAKHGARIKDNFKIKRSKIRGEKSDGMLCAKSELGVEGESDGLWILPNDTSLNVDINEIMGGSKDANETDTMLDISILANRPDLLGVRNMGREVSAILERKFSDIEFKIKEETTETSKKIKAKIETDKCVKYCLRIIEDVKIEPSPKWLTQKLEENNIRPINNVVDVTNFVLLELAQPLHAFDMDKLSGDIVVRSAKEGEKINSLDDVERTLTADMMVVADSQDVQAIAGIMGGKDSEVTDSAKNILLEAACFNNASVRKTTRILGLTSESSKRFEKGVNPYDVEYALDRAASLISEITGGKVLKGIVKETNNLQEQKEVELSISKAEKILGIKLPEDDVYTILKRLSIKAKISDKGIVKATVPSFRVDIIDDVDLIEEIARLNGFDKIPVTFKSSNDSPEPLKKPIKLKKKIKEILVNNGFYEVLNYPFVDESVFRFDGDNEKEPIKIINPLSEDQSCLRDSVISTLLTSMKWNVSRQSIDLKLFEMGPVFNGEQNKQETFDEKWKLGLLLTGLRFKDNWSHAKDDVDFYDVKGTLEDILKGLSIVGRIEYKPLKTNPYLHPGKSASLFLNNKEIGVLGEVHPLVMDRVGVSKNVFVLELDLTAILPAYGNISKFKPLNKYPSSSRDMAFIVDETVPYKEIVETVLKIDTKYIDNVSVFDIYYGKEIPKGKRSLALRINYRSFDSTLSAEQVEGIHEKVSKDILDKFEVEVRN